MPLDVVILAAGQGSRMKTALPKVMHTVGGIPMLQRVVEAAKALQPHKIHVVYGNGGSRVKDDLAHLPVHWVEQVKPQGTGHALACALKHCKPRGRILVLYGDVPLLDAALLQALVEEQKRMHGLAFLTAEVDDPTGFGRIVRDDHEAVQAIVEHCDADIPTRAIKEINTGILCGEVRDFKRWLPQLHKRNTQKEYYLTDVVAMAVAESVRIDGVKAPCCEEVLGANDLVQLAALERYYQVKRAHAFCRQGVKIVDPRRLDVRGDAVSIQPDVIIEPNVMLEGNVTIGARSHIHSHVVLRDCVVDEDCVVLSHSVLEGAHLGRACQVGPFARLRPGTVLAAQVKVGNFVELKQTVMGEGSKASHLSYLGDARIGCGVNIGAGTITCNYDGKNKFETVIHDHAFIGANTALVAPMTVGAKATVGAGSTLSQDVPADALVLARSKARTVLTWCAPRFEEKDITK